MNFLDFKQFESYGYNDEAFIEKHEEIVAEFEKKLEKEIPGFDRIVWWDKMIELDKEMDFDDDLSRLTSDWWQKMYMGKWNKEIDDNEVTPEYIRVEKSIQGKIAKPGANNRVTGQYSYNQRRKVLMDALLVNAIEKNWNEWKSIYQKWIDYVKSKRGYLTGKKYGLS